MSKNKKTNNRMIIVWSDKDTGKTKIANRIFRDDESINQYYKTMRNRVESLMIVLPYSHLPRIKKLQKEEKEQGTNHERKLSKIAGTG